MFNIQYFMSTEWKSIIVYSPLSNYSFIYQIWHNIKFYFYYFCHLISPPYKDWNHHLCVVDSSEDTENCYRRVYVVHYFIMLLFIFIVTIQIIQQHGQEMIWFKNPGEIMQINLIFSQNPKKFTTLLKL